MASGQWSTQPADADSKEAPELTGRWKTVHYLLLAAWGLLALLSVPLLLAMPLTADPVLYDLQAKTALNGGVLYRDIVEPNLPGIVWIHMVVRSLLGWSRIALRSVDLVVVSCLIGLMMFWVRRIQLRSRLQSFSPFPVKTAVVLTGFLMTWFYASTSEWCHCQRDTWMLLPCMLALSLRILTWDDAVYSTRPRVMKAHRFLKKHLWCSGLIEGLLWGMAFWIKPFIAIPALGLVLLSILFACSWRRWIVHTGCVILGGALIGCLGSSWLIATGVWPHFWEMALQWNPEYFEVGSERRSWGRLLTMLRNFYPFSLLHLIAIPVAVANVIRMTRLPQLASKPLACLSVMYLCWLGQSLTLQHAFDYIHVPEMLMAIAICCTLRVPTVPWRLAPQAGLAWLLLAAILFSPATQWSRISWWSTCLSQGSTPAVKTGLAHYPLPNWNELQPVIDFLKTKSLRDGELTAYNVFLVHLYSELEIEPSSRYVYLDVLTRVFRKHHLEIVDTMEAAPHQYVVSSLLENGLYIDDYAWEEHHTPQLPQAFPSPRLQEFPYNQKLVFRSGQYLVHEIVNPISPMNADFSPLENTSPLPEFRSRKTPHPATQASR